MFRRLQHYTICLGLYKSLISAKTKRNGCAHVRAWGSPIIPFSSLFGLQRQSLFYFPVYGTYSKGNWWWPASPKLSSRNLHKKSAHSLCKIAKYINLSMPRNASTSTNLKLKHPPSQNKEKKKKP